MNLMYYRMVNGYGYYPSLQTTPSTGPSPGAGLLGSGATAAASGTLPLGGASAAAAAAAASSLVPKWVVPNFSATQVQYMFRNRMDKGLKVNKAVKCELCSITLNSEQQAQQHYSGKSHLKKLRQGKKKDGESEKDSDRRRSKDRGKFRDKNRSKDKDENDEDDDDDESKDDDSSSRRAESDSKSEKDDAEVDEDPNENDNASSSKENEQSECSEDSSQDKLEDNLSETMSPKESDTKDVNCDDLERSETCVSSSDLERSKVICQNIDKSQNETQDCDRSSTTDSLVENMLEDEELNCERITDPQLMNVEVQPGTAGTEGATDKSSTVNDDSLEAPTLPLPCPDSLLFDRASSLSSSQCSRSKSVESSDGRVTSVETPCPFGVPLTSASIGTRTAESFSSCDSSKQAASCVSPSRSRSGSVEASGSSCLSRSSSLVVPNSATSTTVSSQASRTSSSFYTSFSRTSTSDGLRSSRPVKRPYDSLSRSTYHPHSLSSSLYSPTTSLASALIPHKKPHTSYLNGGLNGTLDLRSQALLTSPHLALTPSSIPGYSHLQAASTRHISDPTVPSPALIRPMVQATSLASPLSSYSTPQYGSALQGSMNPSAYPLSYQPDLSAAAMQRGFLNQFYPQSTPTATPQTPTMLQTPDPLGLDQSLINTDLMTSPMVGQQVTLKYPSAVPTTTSVPYQYGTSYQAISIQALGSDPSSSAVYPAGLGSSYSSNTSPQYLSFADLPAGGSPSGAITPQVQAAVSGWTPVSTGLPSRVPATLTPQQGQGQFQTHAPQVQSYQTAAKTRAGATSGKLDPVSQAVYDNVLGNLPMKRKREIPCQTCDLVFNSEAQANAHFIGAKHVKKQKVQEVPREGEDLLGGYSSYFVVK